MENDLTDTDHHIPREREQSLCPCKSRQTYAMCCLPYHQGKARPETAEQLMRSRYSAYFFRNVDYLVETTHPDTRESGLRQSLEKTIHQANWSYLTILGVAQGGKEDKRGKVEFVADYYVDDEPYEMHEVSRFKRFKGAWKYLDGSNFWKVMFVVGALPAFLCVFLQIKLKEPEAWIKAKQEGKVTGVKFGSYKSLFSDPRWLRHSIFGMVLCVAGVIGIWGIGFFSPELVRDVIKRNLAADGVDPSQIDGYAKYWVSINMICQNAGAFFGMLTFSYFAQRFGRKITFTFAFIAAMLATIGYFQLFDGIGHIWMSSIMGFFHLALFAGFAIYLPELFPISLRSTGTSFCYNAGRFIAATGPITLGKLQEYLASEGNSITSKASEAMKLATTQAEKTAALAQQALGNAMKLDAFRDACAYMSVVFLLGLVAVWFLPETKGKPLPE